MNNKQHLTSEEFYNILAIRASINKGLSPALKLVFPNIIPVSRPIIKNQEIAHPSMDSRIHVR